MKTITRRILLQIASASAVPAQDAPEIPNVRYQNYARCLPDYLRLLAREANERRNGALSKLSNEAAIRERQLWVRQTFWRLIGGQPERTPLNARVTRSLERPGFRVECVVFESQPNFHISANLYLPSNGSGPFPGVLFQPGHSSNGKAYEGYQLCCQGLVKLGFAVLSLDPMGQGERTYYPGDIPWQSRLAGGADDEHTLPGKQMLLVGDTATRLQTWDAVRALDYLAGRAEVDAKRLASVGQSGGGTNTMLLAAVDERIAAAVACCPNSENVAARDFIPPGSTDDAEQNILFSGPAGLDRWDLLYPLAPKPLFVLVSSADFAGTYSPNYISSGVEEFQRLRSVYRTLGHEDKLAWRDSLLPHGLSYDLRVHTYNFLRRWLQNKSDLLQDEPEVTALPDRELFASPNGNVVNAFKGETPATLARKRPQPRSNPVAALRDLLHLRPWPNAGVSKHLGDTFFRHVTIEAHEVHSSKGVYLPVWLFRPRNTKATKNLLILDPAGRRDWREHGLYDQVARSGVNVCAADLRGIGHMAPEFSGGAANHARTHNSEQHYAWASLILGEPLAAQRVIDIQALVTFLQGHSAISKLHLAARNILTTPALFATALDQRISALLLSNALSSFRDVLDATEFPGGGYFTPPQQMGQDLFGAFVPNLLTKTDLPEIAASIAPRPIHLSLQGVNGETIPETRFRQLYGATASIKPAPATWSPATLSALLTQPYATYHKAMAVSQALLTVAEFARLPQPQDGRRQELHHGEIFELPPVKKLHSWIQMRLLAILSPGLSALGLATGMEFPFQPTPEYEVWIADIAVFNSEEWNRTAFDDYYHGVPPVVIEVLSPSNTASEMLSRESICLKNGGLEFWLVDPKERTIRISLASGHSSLFRDGEACLSPTLKREFAADSFFPPIES